MSLSRLRPSENGNIFVMAFLAVVLLGLITAAIRGTGAGKQSISKETLNVRVSQVLEQANEFETGVRLVLENGASESDIRFAHPDAPSQYGTIATTPKFQVFSQTGGRATYHTVPTDILVSGTGKWEFYGTSRAPDLGSNLTEIMAVLPNVTAEFCRAMDTRVGQTNIPVDQVTGATPDCVQSGSTYRFGPSYTFATPGNTFQANSFDYPPVTNACISCGSAYHYYHVLLGR